MKMRRLNTDSGTRRPIGHAAGTTLSVEILDLDTKVAGTAASNTIHVPVGSNDESPFTTNQLG